MELKPLLMPIHWSPVRSWRTKYIVADEEMWDKQQVIKLQLICAAALIMDGAPPEQDYVATKR